MTQSIKRFCTCLIAVLVTGFFGRAISFAEEVVRTDIPDDQMGLYVDELAQAQKIITELKVNLTGGKPTYNVTSVDNSQQKPWVIEFNISEAAFKTSSEKYESDGFAMTIHETATINRKRRHSAVWVQDPDSAAKLTLPAGDIPESGEIGSDLRPLNELMRHTLKENNIPGATLAVSFRGELLYARSFGYSDVDTMTAISATANMRIASVSKPITAVATLLLVQDGKLKLDEKILPLLAKHPSYSFDTEVAIKSDPRWSTISVQQLLNHSAGWDREKSKDTVFQLVTVTQQLGLKTLARNNDILQYQLKQPLDFEPGSRYAYSNIGYCMLGRIIEAISGQTYEEFVQKRILSVAGMTQTRLGKTRLSDRASDESRYYTQKISQAPAVWELATKKKGATFEMVAPAYGQWDLEVMDSFGGWTSTAQDLVRFVDALESEEAPLLTEESRRLMLHSPSFTDRPTAAVWYGLGWNVRAVDDTGRRNYWHTGSVRGTSSLLVRRYDGYSWAVLFNVDRTSKGDRCADVIDRELHKAVLESFSRR
jgi:CubicO group peptidase (beta-lactamase class C family)